MAYTARRMKKILLVDDEPAVLFALSEALADRRRGLQVVTAKDGREAMAALEAQTIHLVVTDLRMPDVDGFELLAHLRRNHPSLPVILMTAMGTAETALNGALECLAKPFDVALLKRKILDMLSQRVRGRVENISLASFLQLLEIERKTCTLHIASMERRGTLSFLSGKLVGAETGDLTAADAALQIIGWENADIEITEGSQASGPPLPGGLAYLLMEAMRLKDEHDLAEQSAEDDIEVLMAPAAAPEALVPADTSEKVREALDRGRRVEGALATLLAEIRTGAVTAAAVGARSVDLEAAAAGAAELARCKSAVEEKMGLREAVEEVVLTSARHYYLIHYLIHYPARPLGAGEELFLLMILDRRKADLAAAQSALAAIAETLGGLAAA
jgi:CheY-like chemotaxis protein